MGNHFREHWEALKRGRPGQRFQDRYEEAHRNRGTQRAGSRIAMFAVALVCVVIGLVLSVMPGPAVLFFFLAGGLLATESRWIARGMDWTEVRLGRIAARAKRRWRRLSRTERVMIVVFALGCGASAAYVGYRWVSG